MRRSRRIFGGALNATRKFVVYGGDDEFPIKTDTTVISLPGFMGRLVRNAG